ncbi:3beta-hydroxysteroid-dehydrogenase/decarboxylase [Euphorbia lathyris]|uniref:3beta-hydroxysteroid- dehydrogenase/decarboxylase n=1 Tax=Euphorbia lathyris TaxID=212925 RepID=UPI0033139BDE
MSLGERWCVVTGGRGFAARHLVELLVRSNMFLVRIADLEPTIQLSTEEEGGSLAEALKSGRAKYVSADLRDSAQVLRVIEGAQVVFHMAAPNSSVNNYQLHYSVNVQGTKNVIAACIQSKVKRLVYTSSASVVFDGKRGILNGDESLPYPAKPLDSYTATKSEGEAAVIKANGTDGLLTCSLRPSSIFGPGDRLFVPSLVAAAKAGKSKFIIGNGENIYDFTYVENVAHAHICAERALASGGEVAENAAGQAYFITNMEPMKFWDFTSRILGDLGYERPRIKVPAFAVMPVAHVVEQIYKLLGPYGMKVPQLIPSRIRLLSCSRSFNCSKAKDRLGYSPIVSLEEGLKRTIESFSHLRADKQRKREGPSKAYRWLGGGRVADMLLWKDKKQTLLTLLILMAIYCNLVASQSTIITALAKILLLASAFLFIHGNLPDRIFGYTIEKIPDSQFHLSEERSHRYAVSMASSWNDAVHALKSLCKGKDWMLFFKVILLLSILSFLGAISLQSLFVIGLPVAFIAFSVYELKEEAIDAMFSEALSYGCKLKSKISKKVIGAKKND